MRIVVAGSTQKPEQEIASLRARIDELEETIRAIRRGEVDGIVISTARGDKIYTLENVDQPYRLFVETMTEGAVTTTQDGTILYCNAAFSAILQMPLEKIIGSSFFSYIAPDSRQSWNEIWEKAQSGVTETEFFLRNDDRDIPVQLSMKPLSIAQGTGLSIVVTDLTERRRDQILIAEGNLATLILENAGEALVVCDPVMTILRSNPKADELFETPTVNTSLTHLLSSCTPLADPVTNPVVAWAKTGEVPKQDQMIAATAGEGIELVVRRSQDDKKIVLMRSAEIRDNRKALIGYLFIFIDITARKQAEQALAESGQRIIFSLNAAEIGTWELDLVNHTAWRSLHHDQIFGYEELLPEWTYEMFLNHVLPEDRSIVDTKFGQSLENFSNWEFECRIRRKDGAIRWIWAKGRPEFNDLHEPKKMFGLVQDITERKAAEEAIRTFSEDLERKVTERTSDLSDVNLKLVTEIDIRLDAEKQLNKTVGEKEVLLREIHHRVKNNLQIIISLLNLQSRYITDEKILAAIRESQNRVKAMSLVHEKLYQSENISKINLDDYIRFLGTGLIQFYGAKSRGITLTTDIRDIHVDINAAIPLGLIINELISNSIKYAFPDRERGEIFMSVRKENHTLSVLFKDNGVGIPADLDWRNTESLGLRLVISLVEQLNGTIELDQSAGTAFSIVLQEKE